MAAVEITKVELMALKQLALINNALAQKLTGRAAIEQTALVRVLVDVLGRADAAFAIKEAGK